MRTKIDYDIACYIRQFADFNGLYYRAVVNDLLEKAIVSEIGENAWRKLIDKYRQLDFDGAMEVVKK